MFKRHDMHNMGSSSMDMGSMATSTMGMAMETMSHAMNHTGSSNSSMGDMGDMGGMDHMAGMHMYFTREFKDYPVVFKTLSASNKGQAFGIFVLLFFAAFFARFLEFVRNYLEEVVWQNKNYTEFESGVVNHSANLQPATSIQATTAGACGGATGTTGGNCCAGNADDEEDSFDKRASSDGVYVQSQEAKPAKSSSLPLASTIMRDAIRLALCIIPDLFGYTLMLAAMTYTLTYFFAVVIGSGVGRFVSERLMEKFRIKRTPPRNCC
ncbi:Ctr copper transporter family protein [Candida parapsilosis]|uniref:Copper transport protein n=2 Tax=Candida parapsilosis TaxID=5480 RepID=G8B5I8_CANPC|nr:uncharacterized protein CPAR2_602990 [Candida parapsilosis]KAF6043457.1 Ctr copper transporter family protein [Candida parapsilosis]KAF6044046.1 Ctr copper transporter family protein [Candida parapsilosis]KAF6045334.1 Ctr copper transporter family protein [Candida parapsilosis]KAF6060121.1 Ctr copper transporter family protein [Candida parapsilosis]KAI5901542.1 Copper transport protein CTR1 [Candida parapsilosis]